MKTKLALAFTVAALLAACASQQTTLRSKEEFSEVSRYLQYDAGEVPTISFYGRFDSWRSLDRQTLVVWESPSRAYLMKVMPTCWDLKFAETIGFRTRMDNTISIGDTILTRDQSCRITEIRRIDYKQMREDERRRKEAAREEEE